MSVCRPAKGAIVAKRIANISIGIAYLLWQKYSATTLGGHRGRSVALALMVATYILGQNGGNIAFLSDMSVVAYFHSKKVLIIFWVFLMVSLLN